MGGPIFGSKSPESQATSRLATLAALGLNFTHIIDAGANRGHWTEEASRVWSAASFLLVEANPLHRAKLAATGRPFVITVLGDSMDGNISMWESTDGLKNWHDTGNSIFRETTGKPFWGRTVSRNMTTLDAIIERNAARHPMWEASSLPRAPEGALLLKMDVQGAEKLVLRGSMRHVVPRAGAILAELSVLQYNSGAPLAFEMHAMLHELGFPLYDILALHHNTRGLLVQLDGLFLRKDHRMWRTGTGLNLPVLDILPARDPRAPISR